MEKEGKESAESKLLAVVRVRGEMNLNIKVKDTLKRLNLNNKNWSVVLVGSPVVEGMLTLVKDYVTWGEISKETMDELVKKRGEAFTETKQSQAGKFVQYGGKKYKKTFRLSPPRKGYGRNGVKVSFRDGGALGYRGDKINDLLKRMI